MRTTILIFLLLALGAGLPSRAQESPADEGEPETAAAAQDEATASEDDEAEESEIDLDDPALADLDIQTYEEDDDDFVPTEEIPADEAIPFPTDI